MATPEFDPEKSKLLFFCRGRGSGHAIPDIELTKELTSLRTDVDVRFVSYGTGAKTLAEHGCTVIGLDLPDLNSLLDVIVLATKVTGWLQPDLVVSHEEFGALPAAQICDCPAVSITDWFVESGRITMGALRYAREVVFTDFEGHFEEPPQAKGKVTYVGPILRKFEYSGDDRVRARQELGIPEEAAVISVLPGTHHTEARVPVADLVLGAFEQLSRSPKQLVWVAGEDAPLISERAGGRSDLLVLGREWQIDQVMVASNAAITKATRKTALELESLGVPSVALSAGLNPIDDSRARASDYVKFRLVAETNAEGLARDLEDTISRGLLPAKDGGGSRPAVLAAQRMAAALDAR